MQNTNDSRICLIEISPRGGGGSISSKIVPYLTNFNTNKFLISRSLGLNFSPPQRVYNDITEKYVVMRFLPELKYKFKKIEIGSPQFSDLLHCELPKGSGEFRQVHDSRDRVGYFVIGNNDLDLLRQDEEHMLESIKFY